MKPLLVQLRVLLTILLIALSNIAGGIQIEADEQSEQSEDGKHSIHTLYYAGDIDDQDHEPSLVCDRPTYSVHASKGLVAANSLNSRSANTDHPIRAPPHKS